MSASTQLTPRSNGEQHSHVHMPDERVCPVHVGMMMMRASVRRMCSSESIVKPISPTHTTDIITKGLAGATLVLAGWTGKTMYDNHVNRLQVRRCQLPSSPTPAAQ